MGEMDPRSSFTERYRGTEWDPNFHRAPQIAFDPPARRGSDVLLITGAVLVVIVLIVGGFYGMSSPSISGFVAGVVGQGATPSPRPSAIHWVVPTQPPAPAASPAGQTGDQPVVPVAPGDVPGSLANFLHSGNSYVVRETGTVVVRGVVVRLSASTRASGEDSSTTFTMSLGGRRSRIEGVTKDGVTYVRDGNGAWRIDPSPSVLTSNLFADIPASDWLGLETVGVERRNGEKVTHLRLPRLNWAALLPATPMSGGGAIKARDVAADFWVTADGVPRAALIVESGTAQKQGTSVNLRIRIKFVFTNVGTPVKISAPDVGTSV